MEYYNNSACALNTKRFGMEERVNKNDKNILKAGCSCFCTGFPCRMRQKGQIVESCDRELALCETEVFIPDNNFGLLTSFEGDDIVVAQLSDGAVLSKIPIAFDEYRVFLSMIDENEGYLLYCSTPGAGQMMKILYFTKDRWNSYTEADISLKIDGYPTSLSAMSKEQLFIGTQMRSNGFYLRPQMEAGTGFLSR